ncbi:molybdopterin-binding/glycosyltransferase family 2 protein [Rhizobium sp. LjRoot30]|uniref:NTP transferase domain-containing protein n=1 Tax=Rhizobium sp. LjRoot30 TaxID=3342320 RepID=UPI003ED0E4FA
MIFGAIDLDQAEGAVLAHAAKLADGRLPKGHVLGREDIIRLKSAGFSNVIAVRVEPDDLMEDDAAAQLADAIPRDHLRFSEAATGRVNLYAAANGLFVSDKVVVDRFNRIDPAITLACLADHVPVRAGDMVATIKIIPLAVSRQKVEAARRILEEATAFEVKPFQPRAVTLVATELPSLKVSVMDKTERLLAQRLSLSGSRIVGEIRVPHRMEAVAAAIGQALAKPAADAPAMIVVFGASAMTDFSDVIPEAIRQAGGRVEHAGMPVDPGNLLVLGWIGEVPVLGAPGCARSPKENGFDWILNRILAGECPTAQDITGLGVGGLLMEIPTRPQPRDLTGDEAQRFAIAIVVLAAGKASRMGDDGRHKLLAEFGGKPLVRLSAETAIAAGIGRTIVVTGHRADEIAACLDGLDLTLAHNPDFAGGMASSLTTGLSTPGVADADGVLVMLADMPGVTSADLRSLAQAFRGAGGRAIVRAVSNGKRGNPVILPRATYDALMKLEGDVGARHIVETCGLAVIDVDIGEAAHLDVDTPEAVIAAGGVLKG